MNNKYREGQIVKFYTNLRSGKNERLFGKITEFYYYDEYNQIRYRLEEYPEKSDTTWDVPEEQLDSVSLMEM